MIEESLPSVQTESSSSNSLQMDAQDQSFVRSLACVLTHLVSVPPARDEKPSRFTAVKVPSISILDYLLRLQRYFACSSECFVLALVYIDRLIKRHSDFSVTQFNVHRLLVTAVMLAAKFFDDLYYSNGYYAKVGGVKCSELNVLEVHFLRMVDWRLAVTTEEFEQYRAQVLLAVSGQEISRFPEEGD